jgi:hypothetical protein
MDSLFVSPPEEVVSSSATCQSGERVPPTRRCRVRSVSPSCLTPAGPVAADARRCLVVAGPPRRRDLGSQMTDLSHMPETRLQWFEPWQRSTCQGPCRTLVECG